MRSKNLIAILAGFICVWDAAHSAQTVSYAYDALGRLTQVQILDGPGSGVTQSYQYDAAGNRLLYQVTAPGQNPVSLSVSNTVVDVTSAGAVLTVNVAGTASGGTVTFTENGVFLGIASVAGGQASITLEDFPAGLHSITATYSGDGTHAPQATTFNIKVRNLTWLPAVLDLLLSN